MKAVVSGRTVEWDDSKNELNEKKHGIDFSTAALVFTDNARLEFFDAKHSGEEDRYIVLGKVGRVLFVVYTERGDSTRIISARLATNAEEKIYYGDN